MTWLRKAYPKAADLFVSGLRVGEDAGMPCRTRLMAHAFRELCIAINNVHSSNSRKIEPAIDAMVKEYRKLKYTPTPLTAAAGNEPPTPVDGVVEVSSTFLRSAAEIVGVYDSRLSGRDRTRIAFHAIASASGLQADVTPTADRWHKMYDYFVGRTHDPEADNGGTDAAALDQEIQFLEETLESFAQSAIANLDDLDAILEDANS